MFRYLKIFGLFLTVLIMIVMGCGTIYQWHGLSHDKKRYPPDGELISVGTHTMHLNCTGSGAPMVLLDAGAGGWSIHWFEFQPSIETVTKVCSFDRSGLGWSESSNAYDGLALSAELHSLLTTATLNEPFVYVGHSLGANLALLYTHLYPEHVAGLVVLDPGRPQDMLEDYDGSRQSALNITTCGWQCFAGRVLTNTGLVRLMTRDAGKKTLGKKRQARYHAGLSNSSTVYTVLAYLNFLPKTAYQLLQVESLHNKPLQVIYSGNTRQPESDETAEDVSKWHADVIKDMQELNGLSSEGKDLIILEGATHQSMVVDPIYTVKISATITTMVKDLRTRN